MADPAFSVVVPAYNATGTVEATLRSILTQTEPDFELIVVDDGSTDDTPELIDAIASQDARVALHRQANQGVAGARNTGISLAKAPLIAFLDNDDLWMPDYLKNAGAALGSQPDAGFAYTDAYLFDDQLNRIRRRTSLEHYEPVPSGLSAEEFMVRLIATNFIMSSVTVRREALDETGGFSQEATGADDWDLWLRMLSRGWRAVEIEGPMLIQRDRFDSQSKDEVMMLARSDAVLRRVLDSEHSYPSARAAASERLEDISRRSRRESSTGPWMTAIRARRRLLAKREQLSPDRNWLPAAPDEVARAFPDLAANYGRRTRTP